MIIAALLDTYDITLFGLTQRTGTGFHLREAKECLIRITAYLSNSRGLLFRFDMGNVGINNVVIVGNVTGDPRRNA